LFGISEFSQETLAAFGSIPNPPSDPYKIEEESTQTSIMVAGINRMMTMAFRYLDIDCIWMTELEETFE